MHFFTFDMFFIIKKLTLENHEKSLGSEIQLP